MNIPFKIDLTGKTAVITGGSGVLCSKMAAALAECGANIALIARSAEKLEKTAEDIRKAGVEVLALSADVLDKESLLAAEKIVSEKFGPCDILVNGAGGNHPDATTDFETIQSTDINSGPKSFFDLKMDGFSSVFDINFIGTLQTTQIFAAKMSSNGAGTVINISSMSAFSPLTKVAAYSAAKAAINNFTEWLAVHLAPTGVRVNAIAPGFFLTDQNRALLLKEDGSFSDRANKVLSQTPMNRFGKGEELLGALLWLASEEASSFVTGTVIPVDGGFNAFSGV